MLFSVCHLGVKALFVSPLLCCTSYVPLILSFLCLYLFSLFVYINRLLDILCIFKTHKQIIHLNHIETSSSLITCKFVNQYFKYVVNIYFKKHVLQWYIILNICNSGIQFQISTSCTNHY